MVEIITIEKAELIRLIDTSVAGAIEKAIHSSQPPHIMTKSEVAKYLKKSSPNDLSNSCLTSCRSASSASSLVGAVGIT